LETDTPHRRHAVSAPYYKIMFDKVGHAELVSDEADDSPLGAHEVAGRTLFSLVSAGTELNLYLGNYEKQGLSWGQLPLLPGYASVFRAEDIGASVNDVQPDDTLFCMGPHRSWQRLTRETVIPVPAGVRPEHAVFARMANIGMSILTSTDRRPPQRVLVIGLGLVGLLASMVFSTCGYAVTSVDPLAKRREIARQKGIVQILPEVDADVIGKVPLIVDCTGNEAAILSGVQIVEPGGEVVIAGVPMIRKTDIFAQEVLNAVFRSHATLRSGKEQQIASHPTPYREGSQFSNMAGVLEWIARGRFDVSDLYYFASPGNAQTVYQDTLHKRGPALAPVFDWALVQ
jgi:hypothetical protein